MIFHDIHQAEKFNIHGQYVFHRHEGIQKNVSIFENISSIRNRYPWRVGNCSFTANGFYWEDIFIDIMQRDVTTIKYLLCGKISRIIPL
jgi:hypothetical protein